MSGTDRRMDELDALLSARCDGALDAGEAARLEAWLAASPEARARAAELERVDALLRALAQQPIPEARLDRIEAALARRLATGPAETAGTGATDESAALSASSASSELPASPDVAASPRAAPIRQVPHIPRAERAPRRRFAGLGLAAALAAGLLLATLVWTKGPEDVVEAPAVEAVPLAAAPTLASDTPNGVAELDLEALDAASGDVSDFEVIEELELLEFLAAREREAGEPQG